jgi:hypothetical protein
MTVLFPDTYPEAEAVLIRLLREAPPWRKIEMVDQLNWLACGSVILVRMRRLYSVG